MRCAARYGVLLIATALLPSATARGEGAKRLEVGNGHIKLVVERVDEGYSESYYVRKGSTWHLLLTSGSTLRREPALRQDKQDVTISFQEATVVKGSRAERVLKLSAASCYSTISKTITLRQDERFVRIVVSCRIKGTARLGHLLSTYSFTPEGKKYAEYKPLDFIFTPQLRPEREHVIADHTFRSPALMLQKGGSFAALVPDVRTFDRKVRAIKTVGDLQVETADKPFFSFGLENWYPEPYKLRNTHVYYVAPDSLEPTLRDTTVSYGFLLFLRADAPPQMGYRDVVRYHWSQSGANNIQQSKSPQAEPFSSYIRKAWYEFLPQIALDAEYEGQPITLLRQGRLAWSNKLHQAADNDSWFNVWFNSLRTAYGMYMHGRNVGDQKLIQEAKRVLNLALLAPQKDGIAPSIFYLDSTGGHWVADHAWGGISKGEYLPMFHNAWTCYWLLQWSDLAPERRGDILHFTRAFADFLLSRQRPSGIVPSWFHPQTLEPAVELRDENAETAGAGLFLAEFYRRTREAKYRDAAERCMKYIFEHILPERKWFDFETFFSCSRKPLGFFDSYTRQYPQNTLAMHQAAEACAELYALTGTSLYKEKGVEIIDYLCLYQQVWSPRWLSCELFGGFGVQNTDAEWSDSRQGYFAVTLMKYYEITGEREYFERGVAALRAMFSLFESSTSPRTAENYAHSAFDQLAGVTGIHWGTGSSVVSIHLITQQYGDAYVNVRDKWGVGIDGCRIPSVKVKGSSIAIKVLDNTSHPRLIRVKFDKLERSSYRILINTKSFGKLLSAELKRGIDVAL